MTNPKDPGPPQDPRTPEEQTPRSEAETPEVPGESEPPEIAATVAAPAPAPALPHSVNIPPALAQQLAARMASEGIFPAGIIAGAKQTQISVGLQQWQGPYPPPEAIERYENVLPGTFERFISMAERLQAAQIVQSDKVITLSHADNGRGAWLGALLAAAAMAGALVAQGMGSVTVACFFLGVPLTGVCRSLIEAARKPNVAILQPPAAQRPQLPKSPPISKP